MSLFVEIEFINDQKGKSYLKDLDYQLHDHLTEQADWNAEYWDFDPDYLKEYSQKMEKIISQSKEGIEFQALWVGERPNKFLELSSNEFLDIVRKNKIGTSTRYIIKKK